MGPATTECRPVSAHPPREDPAVDGRSAYPIDVVPSAPRRAVRSPRPCSTRSIAGRHCAASWMTGSCRWAPTRSILEQLPTARMRNLDTLLPWNWQPSTARDVAAALSASPLLATDCIASVHRRNCDRSPLRRQCGLPVRVRLSGTSAQRTNDKGNFSLDGAICARHLPFFSTSRMKIA